MTEDTGQRTVKEGGRTKYLVSLAGTMTKRGMDPAAIEAALLAENAQTCDPPLPEAKVRAIAADIMRRYSTQKSGPKQSTDVPPERVLDIVTLATVAARQPEWLWQLYLPFGAITLLSGDPSSGKSWIALDIAAKLSRGELLDGRTIEPQSTLYLTVENPLAEVMRARFDSLDGDPARLHVLRGYSLMYGDGSKDQCSLTLKDIPLLDEAISKYKPALFVVDPIQSYLGAEVDAHRSNETRPVLDGLIRLTEKHHLVTLIIRHLSKGVGSQNRPLHRCSNSDAVVPSRG